jgi:tetratricopeptide (TPR) repeat protein
MDPEFVDAWVALAHMRTEMFQTGAIGLREYSEGGRLAVDKALSLDPNHAGAIAEHARLLHAAGDFATAEESFRKALAITPHDITVIESYGEALRIEGRLEEARETLANGLVYDPLSLTLMFQVGRVEMYLGNPERNIELGERMLEIDPLVVHGYVALLQGNIWRGRFDDAWPWYIRTLAADAGDYETWAHLALFLDAVGAPDLADRYMARAQSLDADAPVVIKCLAMILENRGRPDEAAALADRMLTPEFDNRWESDRILLRAIRDRSIDDGELAQAIARYRQRVPELFAADPEVATDNVNTSPDLALLLLADGDDEQARRLIDASLQWYDASLPEGVYGYIHGTVKAELLSVAGHSDRAMALLIDAVDKGYRWQWKWTTANRNFDALRDRPEFGQLMQRVEADFAGQLENLLASPHLGEFDLRDVPSK